MAIAVTLSYAQTLDGRIATRTGSSQWISGPGTLELAHRLRATHDAILVGVGTTLNNLGTVAQDQYGPILAALQNA